MSRMAPISLRRPARSSTTAGRRRGSRRRRPGLPGRRSHQHLPAERAGLVGQPGGGRGGQFRAHRRVGRGVEPLGQPGQGGRGRWRCTARRDRRPRSRPRWTSRSGPPWPRRSWRPRGSPYRPPIEEVSTTRPYPAWHIRPKAGRTTWKAPRRWTSRTALEVLVRHLRQRARSGCSRRCGRGCRSGRSGPAPRR